MLRKFTAIFLLSLASAVMLAFAVFPHHHHQEYICFTTTHCQNEAENEQHSHDDNSDSNSSHGCVKSLFQTQISRGLSLEHHCEGGHCHHFTVSLFLAANILELLSIEAENQYFPDDYYLEKFHSTCYISNLAGRAPPYLS